ncbi:MAG: hypothetical protein QGH45_09355, partial [Myxococcota bacterium]|nr:hypothetical protein [Myxococcota bacterium]
MKRWASRAPIALALLTQSTPWRAAADDIYVPTDFPTISGALAVATTGDIVHLAPGDYTESWLTVGPGVELQGAGAFRTRIHAIAPTATILTVSSGSEVRAIGFDGGDVGIDGTSLVHSLTVAGCVFKEFNTGIVLGNDPSVGSAVQFLIKGNVFEVCEVGVDASFLEGSDLKLARNVMFWVDTGMYLAIEDYAIDSGIKMFNNVMINVLDFGVFIDIDGLEPVEPSLEAHHNVFASYTDGLVITCSAEGAGTLVAWNDIAHEGTGDAVFYDNSNGDCLAVTDLDFVGTFNGGNLAGVPLPGMITADAAPFLALDVNANDYLEIDLRLVLNSPYVDFGTDAALGMDPDGSDPDLGAYGGSEASNWDYDHDL